MKTNLLTSIGALFVLLCQPVIAQNLIDVSRLDGKEVVNLQGEKLGEIKQVLIDPQNGQVRYAVIEINKLWRINDPEIAVPFGAFKITGKTQDSDFRVTLDTTKDKLLKAPKHKVGQADQLYSKEASMPIYSYWSIIWLEPSPQKSATDHGQKGSPAETSGTGASTPANSGTPSSPGSR